MLILMYPIRMASWVATAYSFALVSALFRPAGTPRQESRDQHWPYVGHRVR